jgi:hypothetical protein
MNGVLTRTARGLGALALICWSAHAAPAQSATTRIVRSANGFLATLTIYRDPTNDYGRKLTAR